MTGGVGWSGRAVAQRRPRVSKLGLKKPSDYHSNEIAVEAARRGGRDAKLKGFSHREPTQRKPPGSVHSDQMVLVVVRQDRVR